jgi:hypothetical protein
MNDTLIDAIWHCLKLGEGKTLAAIVAEAGEFLKQSLNRFRVETELLNLVAEGKLAKQGETFAAIAGKPLVQDKPITPPKPKAPRKSKRAASAEVAEPEPVGGEAVLDEASQVFIRENVLRLGSRYAAERFYQEDAPVDWFARRLAAKLYPEESPSKFCRKPKARRRAKPAAAPANPVAAAAPDTSANPPTPPESSDGFVNN